MSSIHIQHIAKHLEAAYLSIIDMSDYAGKKQEQRDQAFLSRALAAFAIEYHAEATREEAAESVIDGCNDNGIDSIYYSDKTGYLYIVQSKFFNKDTSGVPAGDVHKFIQGVRDLLNGYFDRFNEKLNRKKKQLEQAIYSAQTQFIIILIHTGNEPLGQHPNIVINDYLKEMNDPTEVLFFRNIRQGDIHSIIARGATGAPIDLEVNILNWGKTESPYLSYYGQVSTNEIASWWNAYYPGIFTPNIRMFLGQTEVNDGIISTLKDNPELFWYFNNGITVLCQSIHKKPFGGNKRDSGIFECKGASIVNGAQTVGSIAIVHQSSPESLNEATIFVKFISLENCPEEFPIQITKATNTQNRIDRRDFVSLDQNQERLKTELMLENIEYTYKSGDKPSDPKKGFDLHEATIALACSNKDIALAIHAKREIGRLWDDINKEPYTLLFNSNTPSRLLWRLVQIQRYIDKKLEKLRHDPRSKRGHAVHGNRFIAHMVFDSINTNKSTKLNVPISKYKKQVDKVIDQIFTELIRVCESSFPNAYLAPLFKNQARCKEIKSLMTIKT